MKSLSSIRTCQQGLTHFSLATRKTASLEVVLRIFQKTIRFFSILRDQGEAFTFQKCSTQIGDSIEVLGVFQGVHLIQEFACPDSHGLYLLQRSSRQRCASRCFLVGYNFLSNLKFAKKLELIHLPEITRVAIGSCSSLRVATDFSYLLYRLSVISEGVRTGRLWQVAISISKIFTTTSTLILRIFNARATLILLALTSLSLLTDTVYTNPKK